MSPKDYRKQDYMNGYNDRRALLNRSSNYENLSSGNVL